jgi:hypothetical protein
MPRLLPFPCRLPTAWAVAILAATAAGCAPATKPQAPPKTMAGGHEHDHDHDHAHPETIAAGLVELRHTVDDIATHLASGARDLADDAIHAAGHLLEDLHGLIDGRQELAAETRTAGKQALEELFECFDKLDTAMHAGADEAKETAADVHASVKERIEAAMTALKDTFSTETK